MSYLPFPQGLRYFYMPYCIVFLGVNFCMPYCIVFLGVIETRASCFIRGSKHLKTMKALGLRPCAFICFSVFGTPDKTLALVLDILLDLSRFLFVGREFFDWWRIFFTGQELFWPVKFFFYWLKKFWPIKNILTVEIVFC